MEQYLIKNFTELQNSLEELKVLSPKIAQVVTVSIEALKAGHKIIWCGNGGSAAQSQHLAAELVGRYKMERPALNSISLTVDTSNLTAIGNDYGYDVVFSRQLEGVGQEGDVIFGLSTSGNSKNVVKAFELAKQKGIKTVALVGRKGGVMKEIADYAIPVPAETSAHIQELHITIGHLICDLIEKGIFNK